MPLFAYKALGAEGKPVKGILDADSLEQAKDRLRQREVIVTKIEVAKKAAGARLTPDMLIHFTRDLAGLLRSGLPLYESLLTVEEKNRGHKFHFMFLDLCDQVKQGKALSEALSSYPKTFNPVYISMCRAGENTGSLEKAFVQLYKVFSRSEKFRKQLKSAMIYPTFLSGFCFIVLIGLFLFLIPSMRELLEGRQLHPITTAVLGISNALEKHLIWFVLGAMAIGGGVVYAIKGFKDFWKRVLLKVPLFKTIFTETILMRFSRVLAVLLSSGVPIVEALKLSRSVMNHVSFEEAVKSAEEGIVQGRKLSDELKRSGLFPPLMIRMMATSEETGKPQEMLEYVADIYEEQLERTLVQFTNLIQPVMLLLLGVVVGVVLLSVLLPLTDVSTLL